MGKGKIDNLAPPFKSGDEARKNGRKGGINSGISKRKKRLMSDIYREFLESEYGDAILPAIAKTVKKGGSPFVAMSREIRETTEGTRHNINIEADIDSMRTKLLEILKKQNGDDKGTTDPGSGGAPDA